MLALIGIGLVQSSRPLDSGFAAPQNVNIFGDSDTTFVSWDAVPGAEQYDVEVHLEPDCSDDPVATASTEAFFTQVGFTGNFPPNGYVRVRAANDAFTIFGPWSSIAGPYTPPTAPPGPVVFSIDPTWNIIGGGGCFLSFLLNSTFFGAIAFNATDITPAIEVSDSFNGDFSIYATASNDGNLQLSIQGNLTSTSMQILVGTFSNTGDLYDSGVIS